MFISAIVEVNTEQLQQIKAEFEGNQQVCEQVIGLFQLLSNKVRFRIVCMLLQGEACVQEIADVISEGQMSNISQQLRMLRLAGIVAKRRDKKQIVYRIDDPRIGGLINFLRCEYLQTSQTT